MRNFGLMMLFGVALGGSAAVCVSSCDPPPPLEECPPDTIPAVCRAIGQAECSDGLDHVAGCYIRVDADTTLHCVHACPP